MARKFGFKLVSGLNMIIYAGSLYIATLTNNFNLFVVYFGLLPGLCIGIETLIPYDNA